MTGDASAARRHRRRRRQAQGHDESSSDAPRAEAPEPAQPDAAQPIPGPAKRAATRRGRGDPAERGLRDLVGAGPSQLGPVRAMRARDANRPTDADLADAEREVEIVRRNWTPPKS